MQRISHSQNFLKDLEFVKGLVDKTDIGSDDFVVEIGPGKGIITEVLASRVRCVKAVEVDEVLFTKLQDKLKNYKNVEIIKADFLKWRHPSTPYKVFSNIPFNLAVGMPRTLK